MARTRSKAKGRRESGNFFQIPARVLDSANFCRLTTKSKALILDIGARFNGHNNGDLAAPYSWMKRRNWKSKDTLQKALEELLHFGIIELTRQGGLLGASLYAFSWLPIEICKGKLDVPASRVASNKWNTAPSPDPASAKTGRPPRKSMDADPISGAEVDLKPQRCPNYRVHKQ